MNYESLQDQIVERLAPFASAGAVSVLRLPEKQSEKLPATLSKPRFTVIYAGSEYSETNATAAVAQDEKIFIQVLIESALLYGPTGVLNLVSVLKSALTGFKPAGCKQIQASKHHTVAAPEAEQVNGIWNYVAIFQTEAVAVETFTEDITVLIKKITLNDGADQTIIPPANNQ